jgi:hypothetical protein
MLGLNSAKLTAIIDSICEKLVPEAVMNGRD